MACINETACRLRQLSALLLWKATAQSHSEATGGGPTTDWYLGRLRAQEIIARTGWIRVAELSPDGATPVKKVEGAENSKYVVNTSGNRRFTTLWTYSHGAAGRPVGDDTIRRGSGPTLTFERQNLVKRIGFLQLLQLGGRLPATD